MRTRLTIAYQLDNDEVREFTTEVDAWRDLENATRELQLSLMAQVLDVKPWVVTREIASVTL